MTWTVLHIIDMTLWIIIACSVAYVVFFAIISLFYDKEDHVAERAAAISNRKTRFLILNSFCRIIPKAIIPLQ